MDSFFEIRLQPVAAGKRGAAQQLYAQLRAAITAGRLTAGAQLPATRQATMTFGVSRNTIARAYELLLRDGLVTARHGSGTYVARVAPKARLNGLLRAGAASDPRLNPFWSRQEVAQGLGFWSERAPQTARRTRGAAADFRPGIVDPRLFPMGVFRKLSGIALRRLEKKPPRNQGPWLNPGNFSLRTAITSQVALTRAISCRASDIVITAGAQQAFDLLARVLVVPEQTVVAIEDPGYPPLRVAMAAAGARLVPVGVDEEGLIVDELPPDTNVICVCPSHQFPLGMAMSQRRRQVLLEFARRRNAVIIEDDYDGEFRLDGAPIDALRSTDDAGRVFYVGTFSKCMLPSLRLGFVIAPEWALSSLTAAKNCLDWHCSVPIQLVVGEFIAGGHLRRHMTRLRRVYQQRREVLLHALQEARLDRWLVPIPAPYGMHLTLLSTGASNLASIAGRMAQQQIQVHTLERYYYGRARLSGIVLGLGVVDRSAINSAVTALRRTLGPGSGSV
jgi:GntR family transcriptional regulator / MocR family aminotransferase